MLQQCCADTPPAPEKSTLSIKIEGDELIYILNGVPKRTDISSLTGGNSGELFPFTSEAGQLVFPNVVPPGGVVRFLVINGLTIRPGSDFTVEDRTITWTGSYPLMPTDTIYLELK